MIVQLMATGFRLRDDTETILSTPSLVDFLNDHNVPFMLKNEDDLSGKRREYAQWHESNNRIDIDVDTFEDVNAFCEKYDCKIIFDSVGVRLLF